jgi:hypothetical protein
VAERKRKFGKVGSANVVIVGIHATSFRGFGIDARFGNQITCKKVPFDLMKCKVLTSLSTLVRNWTIMTF